MIHSIAQSLANASTDTVVVIGDFRKAKDSLGYGKQPVDKYDIVKDFTNAPQKAIYNNTDMMIFELTKDDKTIYRVHYPNGKIIHIIY